MAPDYPWYDVVEGEEVQQGDMFSQCPVIAPPVDLRMPEGEDRLREITIAVQSSSVIVVSQSCDLLLDKIDAVLFVPFWSTDEFAETNEKFSDKKALDAIRKGFIPGLHMLEECTIEGHRHGIQIVDFRTVYSLPLAFIRHFAGRSGPRLRLLPPYREHLAQAFARFFMRVGLPQDIGAAGQRRAEAAEG